VYFATVAVGWLPLGSSTGEGPPGAVVFFVAAEVTLLWGSAAAFLAVQRGLGGIVVPLDLTAGAYVAVRLYSFDPYYAPTIHRRYAHDLPGWWIVVLVVVTLAVALLARRGGRTGASSSAGFLLFCACIPVILPGH
jgi:hypothetical protein